MFDYRLALMTGVDLPIPELGLVMRQPSLKEISMIGEEDFFMGIQVLCIKKETYIQDESLLANTNNFQIFMTIMNEKQVADKKVAVLQVLTLLLPDFQVIFTPRSMLIKKGEMDVIIDEGNFEKLQELLIQQFCLSGSGQEVFNPQSKKAKEIAQKLMKARQRVAELKSQANSGSMFSQYISILTVAQVVNISDAMNLTMYQLYDLVERYMLYVNWDLDVRTRLAGGKPEGQVENWMKQIH